MKKSKLLIVFDDDSKINGLDEAYIFSNGKDAEAYFLEKDVIISVELYPDEKYFLMRLNCWDIPATGKCMWVTDLS